MPHRLPHRFAMSHAVRCSSRSHDVLFNDCVGVAGVVLARTGCLQISVAISLIVFEICSTDQIQAADPEGDEGDVCRAITILRTCRRCHLSCRRHSSAVSASAASIAGCGHDQYQAFLGQAARLSRARYQGSPTDCCQEGAPRCCRRPTPFGPSTQGRRLPCTLEEAQPQAGGSRPVENKQTKKKKFFSSTMSNQRSTTMKATKRRRRSGEARTAR